MSTLFKRVFSLRFDTFEVKNLRIGFHVKKSLSKEPNTAEIKLFNLNEDTRHKMQAKGTPFILSAGYEGSIGVIFSGKTRTVDHVRDGADWVTHIKSGDGETAYQFQRFSKSYGPGTSIRQVITECAAALALNPGNLQAALAQPLRGNVTQFVHGYTAHGNAIDILDRLLKSAGFTVSVQNGALQVLRGSQPVQAQAVLLTPATGLVGSPEHATPEKKGSAPRLKLESLLQPQIVCGGLVAVRAEQVNGTYRVENLEHVGDTHSSEWLTKMELRAP